MTAGTSSTSSRVGRRNILSARASEAAFSGGLERRLFVRQRADNDALHSGAGGNRRATGKRTDLLRRRKVALRDYGYRFSSCSSPMREDRPERTPSSTRWSAGDARPSNRDDWARE